MEVSIAIYGEELDSYNFLVQLNHFPSDYIIWEDNEVMKDEGKGVTLRFGSSSGLQLFPFSLLRFLLSNKELLKQVGVNKALIKELNLVVGNHAMENIFNQALWYYEISPKVLQLLSELNFKIILTKPINL